MARRVLHMSSFRFEEARHVTRFDRSYFDWVVANGFLGGAGEGRYAVTDKGGADLGMYEF